MMKRQTLPQILKELRNISKRLGSFINVEEDPFSRVESAVRLQDASILIRAVTEQEKKH